MHAHESVEVHAAPPGVREVFPFAVVRRVAAGAPPLPCTVQANSFGCINVVVQGQVSGEAGPLPAAFLTGPFSTPFATVAAAPLVSASVVVQAWALEPLFGAPAGQFCDSVRDARAIASPAFAHIRAACVALCGQGADVPAFWSGLARWTEDIHAPDLALDVLRSDGVEAAARRAGCSSRHYRRRFVHAMGLAPAAWLRVTRWEAAVQALGHGAAEGLAALSASQGFADQAHLTRETRAFVRSTPAHLRRAFAEGAAPWPLRPAHVRIVQDGTAREP